MTRLEASAEGARGLVRKKTNVDYSKECDRQARTHNQHNRRRSIEKTRSCLDRRPDGMSSLLHKMLQV
jgi:hypothetical protein